MGSRSHRLQLRSLGRLHPPGGHVGRQDGGGSEKRGRRVHGGQIPVRRQQQSQDEQRHRRLRQSCRRQKDRQNVGNAYYRTRRRRTYQRSRARHGIRSFVRRRRQSLSRPSHRFGSPERGQLGRVVRKGHQLAVSRHQVNLFYHHDL